VHVRSCCAQHCKTLGGKACLDLLLTAGFDRYSRDVRRGLTSPHEADPSWQLRPPPFDPVAALQAAGIDSDLARLLETLRLPEPIPVYVLYLPSWVDDDGRPQFRDDLYGREPVLASYYPSN
jgi:murein L,D-transpeptidase YcbB/YkuD